MLKVIVSTEATEYARNTNNTTELEFTDLYDWLLYAEDFQTFTDVELIDFYMSDDGSASWSEVRDCECVEAYHLGGHLLPVSAWVDEVI